MTIIKWSKEFETGIKAFDEEHKYLVETLNKIYNLLKERKRDEAKKILKNNIIKYTEKHFKHEEEIFKKYGYPELERHKKIHDLFIKTIVEKELPKIDKSDEEFRAVISFLVGWLIMHIQKSDKKYGEWLRSKNIVIDEEPVKID